MSLRNVDIYLQTLSKCLRFPLGYKGLVVFTVQFVPNDAYVLDMR
jgi:hypothetical protein